MYQRILVATDGSTLSKKAVNSAIALAALTGAELVALKVVPRYPQSYFEGGVALPAADVSRVEQQWTESSQAIVDAVRDAAIGAGVKAKSVTVKSDMVGEALIKAAVTRNNRGVAGALCVVIKEDALRLEAQKSLLKLARPIDLPALVDDVMATVAVPAGSSKRMRK